MFNIIWSYIVSWVLPWYLNLADHNDWMLSAIKPIRDLYDQFIAYKDERFYELAITGQVMELEKLLNDKFNGGSAARTYDTGTGTYIPNTPTAIYIIDFPNALLATYVWNAIEARTPLYLYNTVEAHTPPLYLYNQAEFDDQADFIIMVPSALANVTTDLIFVAKMNAWVLKYKQAGARFHIINY